MAVKFCQPSIVEKILNTLLSHPNAINKFGETALMIACKINCNYKIEKLLLTCSIPEFVNNNKKCAFLYTISNNNIEMATRLVKYVNFNKISLMDIYTIIVFNVNINNHQSIIKLLKSLPIGFNELNWLYRNSQNNSNILAFCNIYYKKQYLIKNMIKMFTISGLQKNIREYIYQWQNN